MNKSKDKIIALAGLLQASALVTALAETGQCDDEVFHQSVNSLFVFDPLSTLAVYNGNLANVKTGLTILSQFFGSGRQSDFNSIAKYMLSLIVLHKHASKNQELLAVLHSRLKHIDNNKEHFTGNDQSLSHKLSALYQDTLSTLKFRVMVTGNMQYLNTPVISDRIRALLLAGFRAAMLWRQVGGKKWQLIFSRREIGRISAELLNDIS